MSYREIKFKCRSKINESEIWDDLYGGVALEEFMNKEFIKFYVQIFKWSKELPDNYFTDI